MTRSSPDFMLATAAGCTLESFLDRHPAGFVFEEKRDGLRIMLRWDAPTQSVTLTNRSGRDVTTQFPLLVRDLGEYMVRFDVNLDIDGEIVCEIDGVDVFSEVMTRHTPHAKKFVAFDLSTGIVAPEYSWRRRLLERAFAEAPACFEVVRQIPQDQVLSYMALPTKEGLIAKAASSRYIAGRSKQWLKFKRVESDTFIVAGLEAGHGARSATFGAVELVDPGNMKYVGKVGSGFSEANQKELLRRWEHFRDGRGQPILVEVQYDSRSRSDGALRFPVFLGFRDDLQDMIDNIARSCSTEQPHQRETQGGH